MWRMAISELDQKTVYKGQKLLFMGTIKASVKNVFVNGQTKYSAYFSSSTKPIFRSESARYVIFIQMSKEMWDFDTEGAGEIMFHKVVNGFLPELFKRWMRINARHLVTIVMFTRLEYDFDTPFSEVRSESTALSTAFMPPSRDYYRVVVSEMASGDWVKILYQLKKEFKTFRRDVSLMPKNLGDDAFGWNTDARLNQFVISGSPTPASRGNILEAINLAVSQFSKDYIDRDLVRTGISVVVITPGTGVHEVDYNMLKLTTDTLVGTGIGIDLVCLSPMPLHSVPLFMYRNPRLVSASHAATSRIEEKRSTGSLSEELTPKQTAANFGNASPRKIFGKSPGKDVENQPPGTWSFAMPHWVDISFWHGPSDEITHLTRESSQQLSKSRPKPKGFALRCRMYELQMMGVMETELSNISVSFMHDDQGYPLRLRNYNEKLVQTVEGLGTYDDAHDKAQNTQYASSPVIAAPSSGIRLMSDNEIKYGRYLNTQWMKMYDEQLFNDSAETVHSLRDKSLQAPEQHHTRSRLSSIANESILSTSFTPSSSLGTSARPPPETSIHQFLGARGMRGRGVHELSGRHDDRVDRKAALLINDGIEQSPPKTFRGSYRRSHGFPPIENQSRPASPMPYGKWLSEQPKESSHSGASEQVAKAIHDHRKVTSKGSKPESRPSSSTSTPSSRPSKFLSRHISFGGGKFALRADVTTSEISGATAKKAEMAGKGSDRKPMPNKAGKDAEPLHPSMASITAASARARAGSLAHKASLASIASSLRSGTSERSGDEKPTQPIAIRHGSIPEATARSPVEEHAVGSADTLKNIQDVRKAEHTQHSSEAKDSGSLFLIAGSKTLLNQVGPKLNLSTSGGNQIIPKTLSPTSALSPWLVLINPCNPNKNNMDIASQFRRWQHVFPRPLRASDIKWKSLCSPASVPLTNEYFPSAARLAVEYHESPYKIIQNDDDELTEVPKTREALVRELISFRLSHGFQIIIGPAAAEVAGTQEAKLSKIFDQDYMSQDGDTIFMSVGNAIHQLVCSAGGEVEIKRFNRKPTTALESPAGVDSPLVYRPFIRTQLQDEYHPREITMMPPRDEHNWNFIDTFLAGYQDEFSDGLRFWRARFVLTPVEIPANMRRPLTMVTEDSEEEVRLEGIRKLTQLWQRHRYVLPEERHFQVASRRRKDPNPLMIEYQTRDPSAIVATGPDNSILAEGEPQPVVTRIFSDSELYHTSNIDLHKLAQDLQSEKGIPMLDRRWHWRLHYNCFVGSDLTTWLLENFSNIETREEAVDLGNELMREGLFKHVQSRHNFRDGNFFFQIASEYRAPRPSTGWFGSRRVERPSVPSTPMTETAPRTSTLSSRSSRGTRPDSSQSSESQPNSEDSEKSWDKYAALASAATPKRRVTLSHAMRYDVDPRKRSYRPEIINLHYDRLHNPDNCYHIRIDWMNVTAKLIEDSISTWATSVEKYGLKLVELPIAEASSITEAHPFRSPYTVKLALQPPQASPLQYFDASHFGVQIKDDKFIYHKALLRRFNFVLDMEAASCFPTDVDVTYSWGKPTYRYSQYIHKSGVLLAQITDEGQFLFLANRLYNNRAAMARDAKTTAATGTVHNGGNNGGHRLTNMRSPIASPLVRPVYSTNSTSNNTNSGNSIENPSLASQASSTISPMTSTPEELLSSLRAFFSDAKALQAFYDHEALKPRASPSPRMAPTTTQIAEDRIPTLGLPPGILGRESSPMRKTVAADDASSKNDSDG